MAEVSDPAGRKALAVAAEEPISAEEEGIAVSVGAGAVLSATVSAAAGAVRCYSD